MALVEKPDPRKKLILAVMIDLLLVALGLAIFVVSGSVLWLILALAMGAIVSAPLVVSAVREMKEQNSASG